MVLEGRLEGDNSIVAARKGIAGGWIEIFGRAALFNYRFTPLLERHREAPKPELIWNIERGLALSAAITITSCPAILVPCSFTDAGLPVGIQFMAPPQREDVALNAAAQFERIHQLDKLVPIDPRKGN